MSDHREEHASNNSGSSPVVSTAELNESVSQGREQHIRHSREPEFSFSNPATTLWHVPVPEGNLGKLLRGFWPQNMDDRWQAWSKGPDEGGNYIVTFERSWTNYPVTALRIHAELDGSGKVKQGGAVEIIEISWETDSERWNVSQEDREESAKEIASHLSRRLLKVTLPTKWNEGEGEKESE